MSALYPKIEFPVSTGTSFLSHYVEWEHSEDWPQAKYNNKDRVFTAARDFVMSIYDDDYKYFTGHIRDGNKVFPESALLVLVWETFAMYNGISDYKAMPVDFEDVQFYGEVIITPEFPVKLQIMIMKGNNKFEIAYEDSTIVSGVISTHKTSPVSHYPSQNEDSFEIVTLSCNDIYTIMKLRGYDFKNEFQSIQSATLSRRRASIKWTEDWITYLDSLLQFHVLAEEFNGISVPAQIKKLTIDIFAHKIADLVTVDNVACISADFYNTHGCIKSGGVEIKGVVFKHMPIVEQKSDIVLSQTFIPHFLIEDIELSTALRVNLQIIAENITDDTISITNILSDNILEVTKLITEEANDLTSKKIDITISYNNSVEQANVIVTDDLLKDKEKINKVYNIVTNDGFVLTLEQDNTGIQPHCKQFTVITSMKVDKKILVLLRKINVTRNKNVTYVPIVFDRNFSWVSNLLTELQNSKKIVLISERQHYCGLLGMIKILREKHGNKIQLIIIDDNSAPSFNPKNDKYKKQLEKNLAVNILKKSNWGGYFSIKIKSSKPQNIYLANTVAGELDALTWLEKLLIDTRNIVQVCYAGASVRDPKIVTGNTTLKEHLFGMDFSGINERGEKVMGIVAGGAIASSVQADPDLLWPVPAHWTMEDAATVPLAYMQAYYCLSIKKNLETGSTVLINGGAGELCQALISVCFSKTRNIFVTGCDAKQKDLLLQLFPDLIAENIGRNPLHMLNLIMDNKKSRKDYNPMALYKIGGDLIINCLSGSWRTDAMKCIGFCGTFLDLCEYDMMDNKEFGMTFLFSACNYAGATVDSIFLANNLEEKKLIHKSIAEGIAMGIVRPLARVVYTPDHVTRAFRLLSADKNRGKVLIVMKNFEDTNQILNITKRINYSSQGSYLVVSDGTALGVELAARLVRGGARNILLHMKPNSITGYCHTKFLSWKKLDVSLKISSVNLQTEKGCTNLLKEGAKLGPVRGLFIVQNFTNGKNMGLEDIAVNFSNTVGVVVNLDLVSRNICDKLEHFVVLNCSSGRISDEYLSSAIDKICIARKEIRLPALAVHARHIKELHDTENLRGRLQPQPLSAVINTLEEALKQKETNIVSYNLKKDLASEFIPRISRIIGLNNIDEVDENFSLKDFVLNEIHIKEISTAIKNAYQISFTAEKLLQMSIAELKALGHRSLKKIKDSSGLGAFFTYIDSDECSAAEPLVSMATACSRITEEDELNPNETYLLLVPGFEGHHKIFTTVAERLKVEALACQLVPEMTTDSIHEVAANIAKYTSKRLKLQSKFYLLGYSFGVNVALELARIFEKQGHVGVVYCLDSSPAALRAQLDAYLGPLTDSQLQNTIVEHMYQLMSGRRSAELKQELQAKDTWTDKVELCVTKLCGLVNYSHQYKRCLLNSAYQRIILARQYEPAFKLNSELVLLKGIPHPNMAKLPDDYHLSKYTLKPVKVFHIESDHASAHQDCIVSNIVNKLLEPKLLENFKNKNPCWSYLSDPPNAF